MHPAWRRCSSVTYQQHADEAEQRHLPAKRDAELARAHSAPQSSFVCATEITGASEQSLACAVKPDGRMTCFDSGTNYFSAPLNQRHRSANGQG